MHTYLIHYIYILLHYRIDDPVAVDDAALPQHAEL